jgi:CubicO group peptidase (beta-lactamase class C family)
MKNLLTRKFVLVASVFILIVSSVSGVEEAGKQLQTIDELKQKISRIVKEQNIPGATVTLVSKDNIIWVGSIGKSDVATGKDVEKETIFRWGSISKSFVSVAVLMLVERGLVNLDDKISDIVPEIEFENRWESTHPVRLVHCLEHTTGFDDLHYKELAVNDPKIKLSEGLAINPNSRRSRWQPGSFMSYCNTGPAIAAYIVEKVSGMSFEEFISKNIFVPLGMKTASFFYPFENGLLSKSYEDDGTTEVPYDHLFIRPAGSLNASGEDMVHFVQMLLDRGMYRGNRLLSAESVKRMETPATSLAAKAGFTFGYGLGNYSTFGNGYLFHGHEGGLSGFVATFGYNRELNRGFAVSVNKSTDNGLTEIMEAVIAYLTGGSVKTEHQITSLSENDMRPFVGFYQQITPGTQLQYNIFARFIDVRQLVLKNGKLYSGSFLSKKKELTPLSKNIFRRDDRYSSHFIIFKNNEDSIISYDGFRGNYKKVSWFKAFLPISGLLFTWIIMISSIIFGLFWIPGKLPGTMKEVKYLRARVFALLAVIFFFATYILLLTGSIRMDLDKEIMIKLGTFSIRSFAIFFFSICFATFTFLGLYFSIRAFRIKMNKAARVHSLSVSIVNVLVFIYLLFNNIIGIRTWLY